MPLPVGSADWTPGEHAMWAALDPADQERRHAAAGAINRAIHDATLRTVASATQHVSENTSAVLGEVQRLKQDAQGITDKLAEIERSLTTMLASFDNLTHRVTQLEAEQARDDVYEQGLQAGLARRAAGGERDLDASGARSLMEVFGPHLAQLQTAVAQAQAAAAPADSGASPVSRGLERVFTAIGNNIVLLTAIATFGVSVVAGSGLAGLDMLRTVVEQQQAAPLPPFGPPASPEQPAVLPDLAVDTGRLPAPVPPPIDDDDGAAQGDTNRAEAR